MDYESPIQSIFNSLGNLWKVMTKCVDFMSKFWSSQRIFCLLIIILKLYIFLRLSFFTCQMMIIILNTSYGCHGDHMTKSMQCIWQSVQKISTNYLPVNITFTLIIVILLQVQ